MKNRFCPFRAPALAVSFAGVVAASSCASTSAEGGATVPEAALPQPAAASAPPPAPLMLPCGRVSLDPAALPAFRAALGADASTNASVFVLQYDPGAVLASDVRKAVVSAGARLLGPVPGGAYLARGTAAQIAAALDAGLFAAARPYGPEDKGAAPPDDAPEAVYVVSLFEGTDGAAAREALSSIAGCEVLDGPAGPFVRVRLAPAAFRAVAALSGVRALGPWIEPSFD